MKYCLALLLFAYASLSHAEFRSAVASPSIHAAALRSLEYSKIVRISVRNGCLQAPNASAIPLCSGISKLNNSEIENIVLPYFMMHISENSSRRIIDFYSSTVGKEIHRKSMIQLMNGGSPGFTSKESEAISNLYASRAGLEYSSFVNDTASRDEILRQLNVLAF